MKIILIDQDTNFLNSLKSMLKAAGNAEIVGEASNGQEFFDLMLIKQPDIVFIEIDLPLKNSLTTINEALEKYPSLIFIGISKHNDKTYIEKITEAGARGYLLKSSNNDKQFKSIINNPGNKSFFSDELIYKPATTTDSMNSILIIDDFETNIIVMKSSLQMHGFEVFMAKDAFAGIEIIKNPKNKIGIIIVDFRMPGMNGAEFVVEARKMKGYEKIPILMLSSETSQEKKIEAKNAGATGWIKKPFDIEKFLKIIKKVR